MKKLTAWYLLVLLLVNRAVAQDNVVFVPRPEHPVQSLIPYLQVLEDKTRALRVEDLLQLEKKMPFQRLTNVNDIDPYAVWWLKLEMLPAFSSDSFYIGLQRKGLSGISEGNDLAEVWIIRNNNIIAHYETGTLTPVSRRPIARPINQNLFPVSLRFNEPVSIYWRIQRSVEFSPLQLNFALKHVAMIKISAGALDRLAWFYTGTMFILFMFGLVFYAITRERPFAWFTFIAAVLCTHMQLLEPENSLTRWLIPEHPSLQFHFFGLLTSLFGILILQFTRSFTQTKRILPKWDRLLVIVIIYLATLTLISQLLMRTNPIAEVPVYFYMLAFVSVIVISIRLMLTNDLYARWVGFALLWLFVFQIVGILWNLGIFPGWFPNPWAIAQIGMMVILFFALAYRFKQNAKEKAEAAKMLEMDAIKSRFFANISHEFRTPLTLMLGPLKQMEDGALEELQKKKYISLMRRNGERLLQLINQLLDLSKLESGKMELRVSKSDVTGVLKSIASSFESLAEQNQVNYHIHFPEENIVGFVDRDKLEKIVVNLLSNAFRFTASGGQVSFSVMQDKQRLRITVEDNGVGIPREQLNKVFDRFQQVAGTEGGTGIGLSLAQELLQLHKGQISVQSEMGKGSSFRVSLPITQEFYSAAEIGYLPVAVKTSGTGTNEPSLFDKDEAEALQDSALPLVLIVEDNPDLQQYIADTLRTQFRVVIASHGKMGLQKATDQVPDCIISDVMMPEMDGFELCARLKKEPATSHIPIILLTAKAGSNSRIEGLQTGADDYLVKPFDGTELTVRIQNLIEKRKQLRERYSRQVITIHPEGVAVPSLEKEFIEQVRKAIEENIDNELFGVAELANAIHLSRSQLHRKLKALTGQAPNELIRHYRLERALQLLQQQAGNVTEIAFQTGFSSPAYFSKCFSDRYGYSPGEVAKLR